MHPLPGPFAERRCGAPAGGRQRLRGRRGDPWRL